MSTRCPCFFLPGCRETIDPTDSASAPHPGAPDRSPPTPARPPARGSAFVHAAAASPRSRRPAARTPPPYRAARPRRAGGRTPPAAPPLPPVRPSVRPPPRGRAGSAPTVCPPPARHGAARAAAACTRASAPTRVLPARGGPGTRAALPTPAPPHTPAHTHTPWRPGPGWGGPDALAPGAAAWGWDAARPTCGPPGPGPEAREARWTWSGDRASGLRKAPG